MAESAKSTSMVDEAIEGGVDVCPVLGRECVGSVCAMFTTLPSGFEDGCSFRVLAETLHDLNITGINAYIHGAIDTYEQN